MIDQKASRSRSRKVKYKNCSDVLDFTKFLDEVEDPISSINIETQPWSSKSHHCQQFPNSYWRRVDHSDRIETTCVLGKLANFLLG